MVAAGRTVPELLQHAVAARPEAPALAECGKKGALTYRELGEGVELLALGLADMGLRKGDRVGLLGPNRIEWTLADQALMSLGCVVVPLYDTVPPADQAFVLADSGAKALLVHDAGRWGRLAPHRKDLPALADVVVLRPAAGMPTLGALTARGAQARKRDPEAFARAWRAVEPMDTATIVYTSGTTGRPKGVVLTHGNIAFNTLSVSGIVDMTRGHSTLSFLPLSHSLQRAAEVVMLANNVAIHYAESLDTVPEDLASVRPTLVVGVPRVWEKAQRAAMAKAAAASPAKRKLFRFALDAGLACVAARDRGERPPLRARLGAAFGRRVVFRPLRERFGGRIAWLVSGGAPLDPEVERFFLAAGIEILQGYGLTEAGPILTINRPEARRSGTVGRPLPGLELRLTEEGEIVARGPGIAQGYWNRPEDTAATFRDGWLHTGDLGHLDADGYLRVTDRKKELLVLSNGKKVPPAPVEKRLEAEPPIEQAVLVGEGKSYCAALVVPAPSAFGDRPLDELAKDPAVLREVEAAVARVNATLPRWEQVKKVALLPRELTVESGELSAKMSVKRRVVAERFRGEIDALFA